ncbi:MAG: aspartate dehydrogenase [Halobacteriota archaeon]
MIVGIIGCGVIGSEICRALNADRFQGTVLVMDRHPDRARRLARLLTVQSAAVPLSDILDRANLVVECASIEAAREIALNVLTKGADLMLLSVGALVDNDFRKQVLQAARSHHCNLYVPSGAIGGMDALLAASQGTIDRVTITTTKPPASLHEAPYVVAHHIDVEKSGVIFEGTAHQAIDYFPQNINVAATLALAGLGFDRTIVRIVVDTRITHNIHEVDVEGDFGRFTARFENIPSSNNRTSKLAAYSAAAMIHKITDAVKIGT